MKTPIPITIDDLRATARDDKDGICCYKQARVYYDDATHSYSYYIDGKHAFAEELESYLSKMQ